jgi:MATE family multidrug resistance protein
MKQYIPFAIGYLIRLIVESINLVFISNKPNPEVAVTAAVGLGNATINLVGFSIIYGFNSALDTLISQAYGAGDYKLCGLYRTRGMFILTMTCIPILLIFLNSESILIICG